MFLKLSFDIKNVGNIKTKWGRRVVEGCFNLIGGTDY